MGCNTAAQGTKQNVAKGKGKGQEKNGGKANGKGDVKNPAKVQKQLEVLQKQVPELAAKYPGAGKGGKSDKGAWTCKNPQCKFDDNFLKNTECHKCG